MKREYNKFYEKEEPKTVVVKSGELRLFLMGQRLAVSKPSWSNSEGIHLGKTVSLDLAANKGNLEMIQLLEQVSAILKGDSNGQK